MKDNSKIVLVTGSGSGIGFSAVNLMLRKGDIVIGADLKNNEFFKQNDGQFSYIKTDITDEQQLNSLFEYIGKKFGKLDVLLNCAGITSLDAIGDITSENWDRMFAVNLKAVFLTCQRALKFMSAQKSGKIVNISSNAGVSGGKAVGIHYSTSKAGVIGLTKSLALYAADFNVNINCVAPGPTLTPMTEVWGEKVYNRLVTQIPLKRFASSEEIAEAIQFLASSKADFITGAVLNVNGGVTM